MGVRDAHRDSQGKEFALGGSVELGYKLHLFGVDVIYRELSPIVNMNYGFDFVPPHGQNTFSRVVEIPRSVTRTGLDFAGISGGLSLGFRLDLQGEAALDARWKMDGIAADYVPLTLPNASPRTLAATLPAFDNRNMQPGQTISRAYRIDLRNPRYILSGTITPCARIGVTIDLPLFSGSFNTPWVNINALRVSLGRHTLGTHRGTAALHSEQIGTKTFTRENTASVSLAGRVRLELRRPENPRYISLGAAPQQLLIPTNESRHSFELSYIDPAMASAADSVPRYVVLYSPLISRYLRAGIGAQSVVGAGDRSAPPGQGWQRQRNWEVFQIVQVSDGYALRSVVNNNTGYLHLVNGQIRADEPTRSRAQVFRVLPAQ